MTNYDQLPYFGPVSTEIQDQIDAWFAGENGIKLLKQFDIYHCTCWEVFTPNKKRLLATTVAPLTMVVGWAIQCWPSFGPDHEIYPVAVDSGK
jgi:hypothetical protein